MRRHNNNDKKKHMQHNHNTQSVTNNNNTIITIIIGTRYGFKLFVGVPNYIFQSDDGDNTCRPWPL